MQHPAILPNLLPASLAAGAEHDRLCSVDFRQNETVTEWDVELHGKNRGKRRDDERKKTEDKRLDTGKQKF